MFCFFLNCNASHAFEYVLTQALHQEQDETQIHFFLKQNTVGLNSETSFLDAEYQWLK